jgi:hypothetical protein
MENVRVYYGIGNQIIIIIIVNVNTTKTYGFMEVEYYPL